MNGGRQDNGVCVCLNKGTCVYIHKSIKWCSSLLIDRYYFSNVLAIKRYETEISLL